ncbi:nitrilase-related carbon-nitrogen hydrolase [Amycolatopsis jejuensis]|uniref:nitrilase-related carbon-nitrogen hydrolase n=1 Tax=Amycolatopsis jejuensis TaxID=330084 RepID=UPI000B112E56|nr:nitrilase-related carbon-nitrogen hydrolase [Amycolatopsis jejuensis]
MERDLPMKIAVLQATSAPDGFARNAARLAHAAWSASAQGADVLVTPELFLCSYSPREVAAVDGQAAREVVEQAAAENGIWIAASTVEHDAGKRFITGSLFGPDGKETTRYRKRNLFGPDEPAVFDPGEQVPEIVDVNGWATALGICFDVEFPEFVRDLALRGAELLLVPTAVPLRPPVAGAPHPLDTTIVPRTVIPARAFESQLYLAYANQAGPVFSGYSTLADPFGRRVAAAGENEELIAGEISRQVLSDARDAIGYLAAYPKRN